jgi:hypothetical protein
MPYSYVPFSAKVRIVNLRDKALTQYEFHSAQQTLSYDRILFCTAHVIVKHCVFSTYVHPRLCIPRFYRFVITHPAAHYEFFVSCAYMQRQLKLLIKVTYVTVMLLQACMRFYFVSLNTVERCYTSLQYPVQIAHLRQVSQLKICSGK